jgi:hypothetical protein
VKPNRREDVHANQEVVVEEVLMFHRSEECQRKWKRLTWRRVSSNLRAVQSLQRQVMLTLVEEEEEEEKYFVEVSMWSLSCSKLSKGSPNSIGVVQNERSCGR